MADRLHYRPVRISLFVFLSVLGVLLTPLVVDAQSSTTVPRIGVLTELGYIEGQTIAIEYPGTEGKSERVSELAMDLVKRNPSVAPAASGSDHSVRRSTT